MKFVFGYAIPSEVYDYIYEKRKILTNQRDEFEGRSTGRYGSPLDEKHCLYFLDRFKEHAIKNKNDNNLDVGFAVIYVASEGESADKFRDAFFPSTLAFSVNWTLAGDSPAEIKSSAKKLLDDLIKATAKARLAIMALRREVVERSSRTPLLLPVSNFHSKFLREWLKELQSEIAAQPDLVSAEKLVKDSARRFEAKHPLVKVEDPKRRYPCYVDDNGVEFHAPGKALHGLPRATDDHPASCILSGYRRLGAPFNPAFHYDCIKGNRRNLKGRFYGCHHLELTMVEGNPHINIAPNDFVRV